MTARGCSHRFVFPDGGVCSYDGPAAHTDNKGMQSFFFFKSVF